MDTTKRREPKTKPITLRIKTNLYDALPIPKTNNSGRRGTGIRGTLSVILEEALIAKYSLAPTNEVDVRTQ